MYINLTLFWKISVSVSAALSLEVKPKEVIFHV